MAVSFLLRDAVAAVIGKCHDMGQKCEICPCRKACEALPISTRPKHVQAFWRAFSDWQKEVDYDE